MKSDLYFIQKLLKSTDPYLQLNVISSQPVLDAQIWQPEWICKENILYIMDIRDFCFDDLHADRKGVIISILFTHVRPVDTTLLDSLKTQFNYIAASTDPEVSYVREIVTETNRQNYIFRNVLDKLLHTLALGGGLQAIADYGYQLFQNPLILLDLGFKRIAASTKRKFVSDDPNSTYLYKTQESGFLLNKSIEIGRETHRFEKLTMTNSPHFVNAPSSKEDPDLPEYTYGCWDIGVKVHHVTVAYLSVVGTDHPLPPFSEEWIKTFARITSQELQKYELFHSNPTSGYINFLTSLLNGDIPDRDFALWRQTSLGVSYHGELTLLICSLIDADGSRQAVPQGLQNPLYDLFLDTTIFYYHGDILILMESENFSRELPEELCKNFTKFLKQNSLVCGVSNYFPSIADLVQYYQQALQALSFRMYFPEETRIYYYHEASILHLLQVSHAEVDLKEICHPGIYRLWRSGNPADHELLHTLYVYLHHNMRNTSQICEELHIHKNTLFYRINRIKALIDDDFENGSCVLSILLSFEIIKYYSGKAPNN